MYLAFILVIPTLLTACGGASSDGGSPPPGDTTNKPDAQSSPASSEAQSSVASSTVSSIAVSSPEPVSSSKATSSESYVRVSRSSQSSTSQDSQPGSDLLAPEATKLHLYRLSENSIALIWDESFDNVGISHYEITRNGKLIATVENSTQILSDQNLIPYTDYSYVITAFDLAGNDSGASPALNVRTLGDPNSVQASSVLSSHSSSMQNSSSKSSLKSSDSSKSVSSSISSSSAKSTPISSISSSIQNSSSESSLNSSQSAQSTSSSNSSSSLKSSSSSNSSNSAKSTSSASSSVASQQSAKLTWTHPNQRENGQFLELHEIGGYEIRYRKTTDNRYTYIVINSNRTTEYTLANANDTEFEIAVFDINGVYSRFVKVTQ